jgi:hypothetical protein
MKSNALITALNVVLACFLLMAAFLCIQYVFIARQLRSLTVQVAMINNSRPLLQALENDCLEYSKKNPAIDPILESVGLKPARTAPAGTTKPAPR